ncbi:MAG: serine/threonine protein kinase [Kofleriaceae bacterium]|nr:serine/threonine protein kinase [Kofleriaceae bacterium]
MTEPSGIDGDARMIGRQIAGRYRVLAKIGEGGMGAVYRAEQMSLKRTVALKLLKPDLVATPLLLRRFNAEAEAVAKLNHPNTVGIYDFGQDTDGTLFIAMEFVEGQSLRKVVGQQAPLPPQRALYITAQIAASLADAHSHGIVHRDLKPDNVMLQDRGKHTDIARVLDFGIAKLRDDSRATAMTQAGDVLGTPQYMSPEQIKGEAIDGRTDVYALAAILYELLTGRMVFDATTVLSMLSQHLMDQPTAPSARRPDLGLPAALDHLVLAGLAKEPAQRIANMELFGDMMMQVSASLSPHYAYAPSAQAVGSAQHPQVTPPASFAPAAAIPTGPTGPMAGHVPSVTVASSYAAGNAVAGAAAAAVAPPSPYAPGAHRAAYSPLAANVPGGAAVAPNVLASPRPAAAPTPGAMVNAPETSLISRRHTSSKTPLLLGIAAVVVVGGGVGTALYFNASKTSATTNPPIVGSNSKPDIPRGHDGPAGLPAPNEPPAPPGPSQPPPQAIDNWQVAIEAPKLNYSLSGTLFKNSDFKLLVPPGFEQDSPFPEAVPDGNGITYRWIGNDTAIIVISVIGNAKDFSDFDEIASKAGLQSVSKSRELIAGTNRPTGVYAVQADNDAVIVDGAYYFKEKGTLGVFVAYPKSQRGSAQSLRQEVLHQRISW